MRAFLAVALLLLVGPPTLAQDTGSLTGIVTDEDGKPVPGANVFIESTRQGAATDLDGRYVILDIAPGAYAVTASFVGFNPVTRCVSVIAGARSGFNPSLRENESIPDCFVVGYWRPFFSNDIYDPVIYTAEEIERLPVER